MNNAKIFNALQVLGLKPDYTLSSLKKTYRALAKQYHPDTSTTSDSARKFTQITAAYEVLIDKLETNKNLISRIDKPNKPKPILVNLSIGLEDILEKQSVTFKIKRREICKACKDLPLERLDCNYCHTQGYTVNNLTGGINLCNYCKGAGYIPKTECKACGGSTANIIERTLNIKTNTLAGRSSGSKIPIHMQGDEERIFELPGDIIITLDIKRIDLLKYPHILSVSKDSMELSLDLDYITSILGGNYSFNLFNKKIEITIPAMLLNKLKPALKLDLKLPNETKYLLNLNFNIKAPTKIDKQEKELLQQILESR